MDKKIIFTEIRKSKKKLKEKGKGGRERKREENYKIKKSCTKINF